jgi:hypothetical protein
MSSRSMVTYGGTDCSWRLGLPRTAFHSVNYWSGICGGSVFVFTSPCRSGDQLKREAILQFPVRDRSPMASDGTWFDSSVGKAPRIKHHGLSDLRPLPFTTEKPRIGDYRIVRQNRSRHTRSDCSVHLYTSSAVCCLPRSMTSSGPRSASLSA